LIFLKLYIKHIKTPLKLFIGVLLFSLVSIPVSGQTIVYDTIYEYDTVWVERDNHYMEQPNEGYLYNDLQKSEPVAATNGYSRVIEVDNLNDETMIKQNVIKILVLSVFGSGAFGQDTTVDFYNQKHLTLSFNRGSYSMLSNEDIRLDYSSELKMKFEYPIKKNNFASVGLSYSQRRFRENDFEFDHMDWWRKVDQAGNDIQGSKYLLQENAYTILNKLEFEAGFISYIKISSKISFSMGMDMKIGYSLEKIEDKTRFADIRVNSIDNNIDYAILSKVYDFENQIYYGFNTFGGFLYNVSSNSAIGVDIGINVSTATYKYFLYMHESVSYNMGGGLESGAETPQEYDKTNLVLKVKNLGNSMGYVGVRYIISI